MNTLVRAAAMTIAALSAAGAQRPATSSPARIALSAATVSVPLTKTGPFYYVDVVLNGRPFRFTLETGASFFAIGNRVATQLGFPTDTTKPTNGMVMMRPGMPSVIARVDSLTMGGATFYGLDARVTAQFDNMEFDGIISIPVLRDLLWTLDLGNSRLILERGALPEPNGRDVLAIPAQDQGGRIDFPIDIGGQPLAAVIDTRYADWITATDALIPTLKLGTVRQAGTARGPSLGSFEMQGARLNGAVRIGQYSLPNAALVFRNRSGTIVGVSFLEQFAITVDQPNGRIRFRRAGTDVVVPPQEWERGTQATPGAQTRTFGFRMAARPDGRLLLVQLAPGSQAETLGLRENDEVVEVDGVAAAQMNPGIFRAALARGGPVKFVILRDGRRMERSVSSYLVP